MAVLAPLFGIALVSACSSDDDSSNPPGSSGSPGENNPSRDGSSNTDGSQDPRSDASDDSSPGEGGKPGSIEIATDEDGHFANAEFYEKRVEHQKCTTSTEGACAVTVCKDLPPNGADDELASAGVIEVSGAKIPASFRMTPNEEGMYDTQSEEGSLWAGGEDITVEAAGSATGVAAFTHTSKAPAPIALSSPGGEGKLTIPRTKDLDFTWTIKAGSSGKVIVRLGQLLDRGETRTSIKCTFSPADNRGTVPAAALGKLPAADNGLLSVDVVESSIRSVSGFAVEIALQTTGPRFQAKFQ